MSDSYDATALRAIGIIGLIIVMCFGMMAGCMVYRTKKFVEGGYCQASVPGRSETVWVKCP